MGSSQINQSESYCPTCHNPLGRENAGEGIHPIINILMLIILVLGFIIIPFFRHKQGEKRTVKKLVKHYIIYALIVLCIQVLLNLGIYYLQQYYLRSGI